MIFNKFKVSKALYIFKANYYYDETAERRAQEKAISQKSIKAREQVGDPFGSSETVGEKHMELSKALHEAVDVIIEQLKKDGYGEGLIEISVFCMETDEDVDPITSDKYVVTVAETTDGSFVLDERKTIHAEYDNGFIVEKTREAF